MYSYCIKHSVNLGDELTIRRPQTILLFYFYYFFSAFLACIPVDETFGKAHVLLTDLEIWVIA